MIDTHDQIVTAISEAATAHRLDPEGKEVIAGYAEDFADAVLAAFPVNEMLDALHRLAEAKAVKRERGACSLYKRRKKTAWKAVEDVLAKIEATTERAT